MNKFYHPYHLITLSPWPLMLSLSLMVFMVGMLKWINLKVFFMLIYSLLLLILIMYQWWRDVLREGIYLGFHSKLVVLGMKYGMLLFILSEVMFFVSFFWTYFHMFLSPSVEIGLNWQPKNILLFDFTGVPMFNTMILLTSGSFITWSHMAMFKNKKYLSLLGLLLTIILGILFTSMQLQEYNESFFCINDSVYGSIFFLLTGFHGLHVMIGTIFMVIIFYRMMFSELSSSSHTGFEFCAWYWHFVDVVWLILFLLLYCLLNF